MLARHRLPRGAILYVGSQEQRKNLVTLVMAYMGLARRGHRRTPPLVLVGPGSHWAQGGDISGPQIRATGYLETREIRALMAACSLLVLAVASRRASGCPWPRPWRGPARRLLARLRAGGGRGRSGDPRGPPRRAVDRPGHRAGPGRSRVRGREAEDRAWSAAGASTGTGPPRRRSRSTGRSLVADRGHPLVVGIDGRELQGRPTGTGRYLRNLLRHWRDAPDTLVVYFNGPAPEAAFCGTPRVASAALGGAATARTRLAGATPARGGPGGPPRRLLLPRLLLPALARAAPGDRRPRPLLLLAAAGLHVPDGLRRRLLVAPKPSRVALRAGLLGLHAPRDRRAASRTSPTACVTVPLGADDDLAAPPSRDAARARLGVRGPLVLTVGAILNRRRLPELLRAMARLRRRLPEARPGRGGREPHPPADSTSARSPVVSASPNTSASRASWTKPLWPTAMPPRTWPFSSPTTRASACPRWKRPRAACRSSRAAGRPSTRSSATPPSSSIPRDEDAIAEALARVLTDDALRSDLRERGRARAAPLLLGGYGRAHARRARARGRPR